MLSRPKKKKGTEFVPVMRGHLHNQIKKNVATAIVLAALSAISFRILYVNRRRNDYAEFYSCYDPEEHYNRMQSKGLISSDPL